jgi:hypothetical protein
MEVPCIALSYEVVVVRRWAEHICRSGCHNALTPQQIVAKEESLDKVTSAFAPDLEEIRAWLQKMITAPRRGRRRTEGGVSVHSAGHRRRAR